MLTMSVSETKSRFSAILRRVQRGETVLILHRGRPVARLEPVRAGSEVTDEARVARLEQSGIIRRAATPHDASLLDEPAPGLASEVGLLGAVIEDREQGR